MATKLADIEELARAFADARAFLAQRVETLQGEIEALRRRHLQRIRNSVGHAAEAKGRLERAIQEAPELFERPRTLVIAGIRVGYQKQKGRVEIDDEEACIKRIRQHLPEEQAVLLIRVKESVHKPAVYDLAAADLKRLGIRVVDVDDAVIVKPTDDAVDKLVAALLAEASKSPEGEPA